MALKRRSKAAAQSEFFPGFTDIVEIGIGSLATVYRAREIGTNRQVALKLLNVRDASPRAIESFERESIALGAVSSHPNIVTLYRSFRAGDGRPVLVLELCAGSIADRVRDGQGLPVTDVVAVGIKIAGALETAHRAQILHRDVKPQNILITEFGEPALADFGVAMLQSSTQTTAGLFDFTTLHAAPELLEGGETSAATDVYELGSSLYQLIAGRSAFRAYDGESPASVILRILRDPVQPLVNAQVPSALSELLIHAMSKDKASRPPTAAEFAAGLAAIEVDQRWQRTQFLIRDAGGGTAGLPAITRMPMVPRPDAPPVAPPPSDDGWSTTTVSGTPRPGAGGPDPEQVIVERQVIERIVFDNGCGGGPDAGWSETSPAHGDEVVGAASVEQPPITRERQVVRIDDHHAEPEPEPEPQYPIPPSGVPGQGASVERGADSVPTWAFRGAMPPVPQAGPGGIGDLTLDPMSLRRKVTIRSGTAGLVADDAGLVARAFLRRTAIPWSDVLGFEPRFTGDSSGAGWLVALTRGGPVELPATKRPPADLRYLHALLDAYRNRAAIMGRQ